MIFDANVAFNPVQWQVSKVGRMNPNGLLLVTLYQTEYNQNTAAIMNEDNIITRPWDFDMSKNVKAWYANYFKHNSIKETEKQDYPIYNKYDEEVNNGNSSITSEIKYSGLKPQVIVGGNYRKFSIEFFDNEESIDLPKGKWNAYRTFIDSHGEKHKEYDVVTFLDNDNTSQSIKLKINNDTSYIGSVLVVEFKTDDGEYTNAIECEIVGL